MDYIFVNKILKTPIYKQIATSITIAIEKGELLFNDKLPTEKEVCHTFTISPTVVKMAYDQLINEGEIKRIKGKGTYVTNRKSHRSAINEFYQIDRESNYLEKIQRQIILIDLIDDDFSAYRMLKLTKGETCFVCVRVIKENRNPILMQKIFLPTKHFPNIEISNLEKKTLFEVLQGKYTHTIDHLHNTFSSINATSDEALLLNIAADDAIYFVRTQLIDKQNQVLGYIANYFPGEFTEFEVMVHAV